MIGLPLTPVLGSGGREGGGKVGMGGDGGGETEGSLEGGLID